MWPLCAPTPKPASGPWLDVCACAAAAPWGNCKMAAICGRLYDDRTELALDIIEYLSRARVFEFSGALINQNVRVDAAFLVSLFV